jgi:hypothetical protein
MNCKECIMTDEIKECKSDIEYLKLDNVELKTEMKNLCSKVGDLINTIKWGLGIFSTIAITLLGFYLNSR